MESLCDFSDGVCNRPHIICQHESHLWGHQHPLVKNDLALFNFKVLASWCFCKCGISMDFTRFFYWTYQSFEEWLSFFSSNILWSLFLIFMTEKNFLLPRIKYTLKASNAFVDCHNEQYHFDRCPTSTASSVFWGSASGWHCLSCCCLSTIADLLARP